MKLPPAARPTAELSTPSPSRGGLGWGWGKRAVEHLRNIRFLPIPLPTSPLKGEEMKLPASPLKGEEMKLPTAARPTAGFARVMNWRDEARQYLTENQPEWMIGAATRSRELLLAYPKLGLKFGYAHH